VTDQDPHRPPEGHTAEWTAAPLSGWQPPAYREQPLATIGDMSITRTEVITPGGSFPLRGSTWTLNDMTHVEEKIPQWALLLAIIGFFLVCVLSLLLLLVKERTTIGPIRVSVWQEPHYHTVEMHVLSEMQRQQLYQQFNYVRWLATQ
jgi:hypothetical protein